MKNTDYSKLAQHEHTIYDDVAQDLQPNRRIAFKDRLSVWLLAAVILVISLAFNGVLGYLFYRLHTQPWTIAQDLPSQYAGLRRNKPTKIRSRSDYDSTNRTIQEAAWSHPDLIPENNIVALDEAYATAQGLPHAQRWPWDVSKGVYILAASHELHCVHSLRGFVNEKHDGVSEEDQRWPYDHLLHCLNILLDSVICNADDTALYTGDLHGNTDSTRKMAGNGSYKMCRDWKALIEWSHAHSACYRHIHEEGMTEWDRYRFCPHGETPWLESSNRAAKIKGSDSEV